MSEDTTDPKAAAAEQAATAAKPQSEDRGDDPGSQQLQNDLDRFRDLAMRTQADFENFRKRAAREKEDAVRYANASFLERLAPILDNFELGLTAAKGGAENSPIVSGMEMVLKQLQDFLAQNGVEAINAEGQPFDPNIHEAIGQEESVDVPEGNVVRQLRKGYKLRERLLRPATVVVSKGAPVAASAGK